MAKLIDQAYLKAIEVLKKNSTKFGFQASLEYYNSIWARDGTITLLGRETNGGNFSILERRWLYYCLPSSKRRKNDLLKQ